MNPDTLRSIPSVDKVLRDLGPSDVPRAAVVALVRRELARIRESGEAIDGAAVFQHIRSGLDALRRGSIQPVINGTGILLHTNLGRAPLGAAATDALLSVASNYNNVEYDLTGGQRGGRAAYLEHNLAVLCGAEAATVVNNCAAALVLILRHLTRGPRPEVVISRGELVQIGGGFRIPDILAASGATLREVGTTNKTTLDDYADAIVERTAMVLKVHRSNFYMEGFVESPETEQIATLARERGVPFVEDLGSGATFDTAAMVPGIDREPTPSDVLRRGVDLVTFSGDKLFGGPQAGIIAGRASLVSALKKDPFFRALRCDKLILTALQATVDLHLNEADDAAGVPIIEMMRMSDDALRSRAMTMVAALAGLPVRAAAGVGQAQVGGGTLPKAVIPSTTLELTPDQVPLEGFAARLRSGTPPVVGYVSEGRFKLDLRTVFPRQDAQLLAAIGEVLKNPVDNAQ